MMDDEAAAKFAEMEAVDAETFTRSLTGFDEIAIKAHFGAAFGDLDGTMAVRALLFVRFRRSGLKDKPAWTATMTVALGDMEALFSTPTGVDDEGKA